MEEGRKEDQRIGGKNPWPCELSVSPTSRPSCRKFLSLPEGLSQSVWKGPPPAFPPPPSLSSRASVFRPLPDRGAKPHSRNPWAHAAHTSFCDWASGGEHSRPEAGSLRNKVAWSKRGLWAASEEPGRGCCRPDVLGPRGCSGDKQMGHGSRPGAGPGPEAAASRHLQFTQHSLTSPVAQMAKNLPARQETRV